MAVKELIQKYGSSLDAGIVAAYGISMNNNLPRGSEKLTIPEKEKINADSSKFYLSNYPNPFNPTTQIKYEIPEEGIVTLKVYDVLGREVAVLVNKKQYAGRYAVTFSATNGDSQMASGVYIYRLTVNSGKANNFTMSKKMILMR